MKQNLELKILDLDFECFNFDPFLVVVVIVVVVVDGDVDHRVSCYEHKSKKGRN